MCLRCFPSPCLIRSFDREPNRFPRLRKPAEVVGAAGAGEPVVEVVPAVGFPPMHSIADALSMRGVLPMPRVSIVDATKRWIHRLPVEVVGEQGKRNNRGTSGPHVARRFYPTEPLMASMDKSLIGTQLHFYRMAGSITKHVLETTLGDVLGHTESYRATVRACAP